MKDATFTVFFCDDIAISSALNRFVPFETTAIQVILLDQSINQPLVPTPPLSPR